MLPDFVKVHGPIGDAFSRLLRGAVGQRPLIASIRSGRYYEGNSLGGFGEDVGPETHGFKRVEAPASVPTSELIEKGPAAVFALLPQLAASMAEQMERRMIEKISQSAREGDGRNAGAVSNDATIEEYLAQLERLELDFNPDGEPELPMLVLHPEMVAKLREWDADPRAKQLLADLVERKRVEFNARESNRKLVD